MSVRSGTIASVREGESSTGAGLAQRRLEHVKRRGRVDDVDVHDGGRAQRDERERDQ
jgi:hypothetical protein